MSSGRSVLPSLENFEETKKHADQLIQVLKKLKFEENCIRALDGVSKLKAGLLKTTEQQQETLSKIKKEKTLLLKEISETCSSIVGAESSDLEQVSEVVTRENDRFLELKTLADAKDKENRAIAEAELQAKLLQNILPVQFDLNSTHTNIKGFVRKPNSKIEPFAYSSSPEHSSCEVANALWTTASHS